ncbi:TPA: ATP-binding cassette domain-containing protein, partial [Klebsiella pneumoniae]|nr:ATP-binding cassette domain-containing protein [Klebsiella pneumoniae]
MANVSLRKVVKSYSNGFKAVHGIDLDIQDGEFMVFVGPSGCAKSTTLRMIAGLEDITTGEIYIG